MRARLRGSYNGVVPGPTTPAERLRIALEMFDEGVELMRRNLSRRHPDSSEEDIERLLVEWLHERPGAEHGDGEGRPRR